MANVNKPSGLRPVGTFGSAGYAGRIETFYVPSTDSTAIGLGDPVTLAGGLHTDGTPIATRATAAAVTCGVMVGVVPIPTDLTVNYRKASTSMYILVDTDPNTIYEIQEDSDGGYVALASGTQNAPYILGTVDTATGNGETVLDSSSVAANAALDLLILRPSDAVDNEFPANYAKWLVKLNLHQFAAGIVRVGV
jgi:hypothetical protein